MNYYLAGPFWDKECSEFFNEFTKRCKETIMTNDDCSNTEVEVLTSSSDNVFVPGHFKVDFNKIKSEYDPASFRRVLKQVLDLDLENITDGMVVYPKGYDLGSMFELGYFLSNNIDSTRMSTYNNLKKRLIIKDPDEVLIDCIDTLVTSSFYYNLVNKYSADCSQISSNFVKSDGSIHDIRKNISKYRSIALNVDCYKETPFNSMLAGYLYGTGIPFFTYSCNESESNVMMIASSMFHLKIEGGIDDIDSEIESKLENLPNLFWDDSCFNRFKDIK